jgi:Delta14-sterol reductase
MEIRPGMLGWILVNLSSLAHQYNTHGKQGPLYLSDSIILITTFQTLYVLDALYMEPAILTTIDITSDGFGFMLAFGDLVWLPLTYSIQTRYLAIDPVHLGPLGILLVFAVQALGFYIFRSANNEKNRFRTDPSDSRISHLKFIPTRAGSRLLVSGWWGAARHINYFGDWIMSWSYTLPTGFAGYQIITNQLTGTKEILPGEARGWGIIFTYFYVLYFAVLLIHRERRDEEKCRKKYGADWEEYVRRVRSRIVPGIY